MRRFLSTALCAVLACACGGGEDNGTVASGDDAGLPDANQLCAIAADLGDVGTIPAEASVAVRKNDVETGDPELITYIGALNGDPESRDQLVVQLYRGFGVFTSRSIEAGDYELTGDELNYKTCGVCVRIFADRPTDGGRPAQDMMATGGTLHVEAIGGPQSGSFKATLSGASFEHVVIDDVSFESKPVDDGCETSISNVVADTPMSVLQ